MIPLKVNYEKDEILKTLTEKVLELNNFLKTIKEDEYKIEIVQSEKTNTINVNLYILEKIHIYPIGHKLCS
jgi:hypothetical protein